MAHAVCLFDSLLRLVWLHPPLDCSDPFTDFSGVPFGGCKTMTREHTKGNNPGPVVSSRKAPVIDQEILNPSSSKYSPQGLLAAVFSMEC